MSKLTLPDAPKASESLRKALPQLYRALKKSGAKRVPKLTWPAPAALAPRLAELPNQRRCPHHRYRRVRLLLQHVWKSDKERKKERKTDTHPRVDGAELEVWIAELEIRAATPPGALYSAESARQRSIAPGITTEPEFLRILEHARLMHAWRVQHVPGYLEEEARLAARDARLAAVNAEARRARRR